jgi:hypothetical protein
MHKPVRWRAFISHQTVRSFGPRPVARSTTLRWRVANADLRYEHAKKRGPLTALLLACNLFGDSFFEASCRLGGKTAGHFLRIFKHIERIYLAPPQGEHVETMVEVRSVAVEQRCGTVPLRKHGGMPRPALHPDVVDLEMDIGQNAAEAFKPAAQGFFVVALTTKRVGAGKVAARLVSAPHPSDGC